METTNWMMQHVEKAIRVKGLKENKDFEVVSLTVMDHHFELLSIDYFLRVNGLNDLLMNGPRDLHPAKDILQKLGLSKRFIEVSKTPFPKNIDDGFLFFKMVDEIDFELAVSLGLGVVKMLSGEYTGGYLLYYPLFGLNEGLMDCYQDDQQLLIRIYSQLKYPNHYDPGLEKLVKNDPFLLSSLIMHDPQKYISRLAEIFKSKFER